MISFDLSQYIFVWISENSKYHLKPKNYCDLSKETFNLKSVSKDLCNLTLRPIGSRSHAQIGEAEGADDDKDGDGGVAESEDSSGDEMMGFMCLFSTGDFFPC